MVLSETTNENDQNLTIAHEVIKYTRLNIHTNSIFEILLTDVFLQLVDRCSINEQEFSNYVTCIHTFDKRFCCKDVCPLFINISK